LRINPVPGPSDSAARVLEALQASWRAEALGDGRFAVWLPEDQCTSSVFAAVRKTSATVRSMQLKRRSLEDVFLTAVRGSGVSS